MDLTQIRVMQRLQQEIGQVADEHGWWDDPRNDGECIALMHSELSECLEALRHPGEAPEHVEGLPAVAEELADTVIRIFDFCEHRGIDLARAIHIKHAFNVTRPHRHGGKRF